MDVFLTGATGYVGLNLVHHLQDANHQITALVRSGSRTERLPDSVTTVRGELSDINSLHQGIEGQDVVVHLAALLEGNSEDIEQVNINGTDNVATVAEEEGVKNFVFASTIRAHPDIPSESLTEYEESKQEAEESLQQQNIDTTIIYPTYIWGPRDYKLTRYHYIQKVESNILLIPPFYTQRNFNIVHVDDVCHAIIESIDSTTKSRVMVTGENISAKQLFKKLADQKVGRCGVLSIPKLLTRRSRPIIDIFYERGYFPVEGDKLLSSSDIGTVPKKFESLNTEMKKGTSQAIKDTYKWYRNIGLVNSDTK